MEAGKLRWRAAYQESTDVADSFGQLIPGWVQVGPLVPFAMRSPNDELNQQGKLYTVDKTTGVATLIGGPGAGLLNFFGAITFAPNGTLYMTAADLDPASGLLINPRLLTLNPDTGQILSTVNMQDYLPALGVRPEDGVLFGGIKWAGPYPQRR